MPASLRSLSRISVAGLSLSVGSDSLNVYAIACGRVVTAAGPREAYVDWVRRFVLFHGRRHPAEMGEAEISAYLTDLAVVQKISASTQNQALHALLFLYRHVLMMPLVVAGDIARARRGRFGSRSYFPFER